LSETSGGVDEAGRGCIAGPLVVAGVCADESAVLELGEIGVKDSKLLSPAQREVLYPEVLRICRRVESARIQPSEIDSVVRAAKKYRRLNFLEAKYMAEVIDRLDAAEVFVDSCDVDPSRFQDTVSKQLRRECRILASHHADREKVVVSAASVVAKVERDNEVRKLRERYGDFGSGYPSDPKTRVFFIEWLRREETLPSFVRTSWRTWDALQQSVLFPL